MGITIYARGNMDRLEDIPHLIEEVKTIAQKHDWTFSVVDDDFDVEPSTRLVGPTADKPAVIKGSLGLKGIVLSVDSQCESLAILFDKSGALTNGMQQLFRSSCDMQQEPFTACKTQSGCIESHIQIVELLHVLNNKYISDLSVTDEGDYWESGDVEQLSNKRKVLEHYLDYAKDVISGIRLPEQTSLGSDTIAAQIEQALLKAEEDQIIH